MGGGRLDFLLQVFEFFWRYPAAVVLYHDHQIMAVFGDRQTDKPWIGDAFQTMGDGIFHQWLNQEGQYLDFFLVDLIGD